MKILKQLKKYYFGMSRVSSALLALSIEISIVTYLAAIMLYIFSPYFTSPDLITDMAFSIGQNAMAIAWGGILLSMISDIIVKYDHPEEDSKKKEK